MVQLLNDKEKALWRRAAVAALKTMEGVEASQAKASVLFASLVADGIVMAYRKKCGDESK